MTQYVVEPNQQRLSPSVEFASLAEAVAYTEAYPFVDGCASDADIAARHIVTGPNVRLLFDRDGWESR